jgi:hypothetical protein
MIKYSQRHPELAVTDVIGLGDETHLPKVNETL